MLKSKKNKLNIKRIKKKKRLMSNKNKIIKKMLLLLSMTQRLSLLKKQKK